MRNPHHQMALVRLRVELFTAMQVMKGEDLDDFVQLIEEVQLVLPKKATTTDEG